MPEQTIQQSMPSEPEQSASWDDTADGAAYQGYEDETDVGGEAYTETESDDTDFPTELEPDGIGLNENGDIDVGDDFFGELKDAPDEEPNEERPDYYTDEELKNTPFENWDTQRLNGDIQKFAPIVQEQIQRRNAQTRAQTIQNAPFPSDIPEPKQYTPKELSDEAKTLACEKLGLEDPEDFDDYEPEHRAAMQLAMNELMDKRNTEVQGYQRGQSEWATLQRFNAELSQQPDFRDFNEWYSGKLQEAGVTAEQVNAGLYEYAKRNGNRFGLIPKIIGSWYMEYQRERGGANAQARPANRMSGNYPAAPNRYPRNETRAGRPNPAVLESSGGNSYEGRRRVNMRDFGEMDADEQAQALIRMGLA